MNAGWASTEAGSRPRVASFRVASCPPLGRQARRPPDPRRARSGRGVRGIVRETFEALLDVLETPGTHVHADLIEQLDGALERLAASNARRVSPGSRWRSSSGGSVQLEAERGAAATSTPGSATTASKPSSAAPARIYSIATAARRRAGGLRAGARCRLRAGRVPRAVGRGRRRRIGRRQSTPPRRGGEAARA